MISKKRAPNVQDTELRKAINQIYDDLNSLISAVNQQIGESTDNQRGKTGNIRLVFDKSVKKYYIEGKFETGWARVEATLVGK